MSTERDATLRELFDAAGRAFAVAPAPPPASAPLAVRVFDALASAPAPAQAPAQAAVHDRRTLPVCRFLEPALDAARSAGGAIAAVASALAALSPRLDWQRRAGSQDGPEDFSNGHANAILTGPGGLEPRDDVYAGMSLIAPGVRYPDHQHPPEEFYIVLSSGEWRQRDGAWHEPGIGGVVHNPPDIVHAMRAGPAPLLALWFLWTG